MSAGVGQSDWKGVDLTDPPLQEQAICQKKKNLHKKMTRILGSQNYYEASQPHSAASKTEFKSETGSES